MRRPILLTALSFILPTLSSTQTTKFFLRSISTHAAFNHIPFGGVGTQNGILVGGLQPLQTLPVGGTIVNGVLSFENMDPSDPIPAYFIHGRVGSWVQLDVFGTPQTGYSLDSKAILTVTGNGRFYGMLLLLHVTIFQEQRSDCW